MSSKAPIGGDEALLKAFQDGLASKSEFGFIQIGIDMENQKFTLLACERSSDTIGDWSEIAKRCQEKKHTYFVAMDPSDKGRESELCLLIHFGPDMSPVKDRMLYASSRATLKSYFGSSNFSSPDYFVSGLAEMSVEQFVKQRSLHLDIDFRSEEEKEKEAATLESSAKSASSSIMQRLPVTFTDEAKAAITAFKEDSGRSKCAIISLTGDDLGVVTGASFDDTSIDFIASQLKTDEPCYLLFWHTRHREAHPRDADGEDLTKSVFGYFCPDGANRMAKFTYSTCKINVMDFCTEVELSFGGKVEFTSAKELNAEVLDYNLFPIAETKELHATPAAPGKKRSRKPRAKLDV